MAVEYDNFKMKKFGIFPNFAKIINSACILETPH